MRFYVFFSFNSSGLDKRVHHGAEFANAISPSINVDIFLGAPVTEPPNTTSYRTQYLFHVSSHAYLIMQLTLLYLYSYT